MTFDINKHVLTIDNELVDSILTPAISFFNKTKKYGHQDIPNISGVGVYAIYINKNNHTIYNEIISEDYPIYVGKAVPSGSRQGRSSTSGKQLKNRLREHFRSIKQSNLPANLFMFRFMIMIGVGEDLIPPMESTLIRKYLPLWNSHIDGFGNHDPGKGRLNQQPSEWDTLHPGRSWADKLTGAERDIKEIEQKIKLYSMRQ